MLHAPDLSEDVRMAEAWQRLCGPKPPARRPRGKSSAARAAVPPKNNGRRHRTATARSETSDALAEDLLHGPYYSPHNVEPRKHTRT